MGVVLLHTDVYSFLTKPDKKKAEIYQQHVEGATLALTFVTIGELHAGAAKAKWAADKIEAMEQNLKMFVKVPFDSEVCRVYGSLKFGCKTDDGSHRVVASNDLWIASCAIRHRIPLVSNNRKHFEGIPGLNLISEAPAVSRIEAQFSLPGTEPAK